MTDPSSTDALAVFNSTWPRYDEIIARLRSNTQYFGPSLADMIEYLHRAALVQRQPSSTDALVARVRSLAKRIPDDYDAALLNAAADALAQRPDEATLARDFTREPLWTCPRCGQSVPRDHAYPPAAPTAEHQHSDACANGWCPGDWGPPPPDEATLYERAAQAIEAHVDCAPDSCEHCDGLRHAIRTVRALAAPTTEVSDD